MHQEVVFSCGFWRKWNFACKSLKSRMKVLIVRYTRNCLPRYIYVTVHRKVSLFQPWQSVRGVTPTFSINWCSLPGLMFRSNLLWMGLAGTGGSGRKSLKEDTRCDVKNLGVYIDATLSMVKHIDYTSHSAYIYLEIRRISCIWHLLSLTMKAAA